MDNIRKKVRILEEQFRKFYVQITVVPERPDKKTGKTLTKNNIKKFLRAKLCV